MNRFSRIRIATVLLSALLLIGAKPQASFALSFEELFAVLDQAPQVIAARLEQLEARQRLAALQYPGDPSAALIPAATATTAEGDSFGTEKRVTATVTAEIPIGLSETRRVSVAEAEDALLRAEEAVAQSRAEAYLGVFMLYKEAWLAGREQGVIEAEVEAARERARTAQERFDRGGASLEELNSAEESLLEAEAARREGTLGRRITWMRLAYAVGLEPKEAAELEPLESSRSELPAVEELISWALRHDGALLAAEDQMAAYRRESAAALGLFRPPTLRTGFSGWEQTASVSLNTENPTLALSYGFPVVTEGEIPESRTGSRDPDTWELSFSVVLPFQAPGGSRLEGELRETLVEQAMLSKTEAERELSIEIRSRYNQYTVAGEFVDAARRSVESTGRTLKTVRDRREEGRATAADLLLAEAQYRRALYRLDAAVAEVETAKLQTAAAASYLNELIGSME